jgi:hypothetical protein
MIVNGATTKHGNPTSLTLPASAELVAGLRRGRESLGVDKSYFCIKEKIREFYD